MKRTPYTAPATISQTRLLYPETRDPPDGGVFSPDDVSNSVSSKIDPLGCRPFVTNFSRPITASRRPSFRLSSLTKSILSWRPYPFLSCLDHKRRGKPCFIKASRVFSLFILEAAPGFEPGIKDLQSSALPLGYAALKNAPYLIRRKSIWSIPPLFTHKGGAIA